jgi:hypothetical protein
MTRPDGFCVFRDAHRIATTRRPEWRDASVDAFHTTWVQHLVRTEPCGSAAFRAGIESALCQWAFLRLGRPYCKVHAGIAAMLARTSIDIPAVTLVLSLPAFEIRLPAGEANPMRERPDTPPLAAVLVAWDLRHIPDLRQIDHRFDPAAFQEPDRIRLYLDFGESATGNAEEIAPPVYTHLFLDLVPGEPLEAAFQRSAAHSMPADGYRPGADFIRSTLALAIAVCFFLAEQHELIAPDVSPRLVKRFRRAKGAGPAGDKEAEKILNASRKRGYHGWHLGREIELPRPLVTWNDAPPAPPHGSHELRFAHLRSGHLRWQAHGPSQADRKLVFIRPTIVRPDLPLPGSSHRYVIPDSVLPSSNGTRDP